MVRWSVWSTQLMRLETQRCILQLAVRSGTKMYLRDWLQ
eukprot:COSAG03_NODE_14_length_22296_cov_10.813128_14_plen_39_part_00